MFGIRLRPDFQILASVFLLLLTARVLPAQTVTTPADLVSAIAAANANPTATTAITLAAGTYNLTADLPDLAANNLTLQGPTTGAPAIVNATALASGVIFNVTTDHVTIANITLQNARSHAVTIQAGADSGRIEDCTFAYPTAPVPATAAIDGFNCQNWTVTGNNISGIVGTTTTAEPAIHFYGGASGTVVTNNLVLNCDRAVGFGGDPTPIAPVVKSQPLGTTATIGLTASFTVSVAGTPAPTYQWYKNGVAISGATSATYTTPATTTADNGAVFTVVITNSAGSVTSASATLTVTAVAPIIAYSPGTFSFTVNTAISAITPTNTGNAATSWSISPALTAGLSFNTGTGQITGTPTVASAATAYTVTATNAAGNGTATLSITVNAVDGALDLPKDAAGWTIFTPSSDTRIMYVSAAGNDTTGTVYNSTSNPDPFNPTGAIQTFKTYAAAFTHARTGYPDWILFKRGDTFYEAIGGKTQSGRSRSEPSLIGAYGSTGDSPLLKVGASDGISIGYVNSSAITSEYIAVQGVRVYSQTRNPDDPEYTGSAGGVGISVFTYGSVNKARNILIEGCSCMYNSATLYAAGGSPWVQDVDFRRNVIYCSYSTSGHAQGMWISYVNNLLLEENILDHNGWLIQSRLSDNDKADGQATMFNHNIYTAGVTNATYRNNLIMRASSIGTKFTAPDAAGNADYGSVDVKITNLVIGNNLYIDGEIGIGLAGNYPDNHYAVIAPTIRDNVFYNIGQSHPTNRALSWGIDLYGMNGGTLQGNLLLNSLTLDNTFGVNLSEAENFEIFNNIGLYLAGSQAFLYTKSVDHANVSIHDNYIERQGSANYMVEVQDAVAGLSFSNNNYYGSSTPTFKVINSSLSSSQWALGYESNAKFTKRVFPDNTRTVEKYLISIGATGSLDDFYARCRLQTRFNWDSRYTAESVNNWIRAGFGL
jgi:hypothetical protein